MSAPHKVSKERLERIATHGWLACATERVTELEMQVQTLLEAVENSAHRKLPDGFCWCDFDYGEHAQWCLRLRAALAATEPK